MEQVQAGSQTEKEFGQDTILMIVMLPKKESIWVFYRDRRALTLWYKDGNFFPVIGKG